MYIFPLFSSTFSPFSVTQNLAQIFRFHYIKCYFLHNIHSLSTSHSTVVVSLPLWPLLSSIFCQMSVYFFLYRLLVLCHYVHCNFPLSLHSVTSSKYTSLASVSLCQVLSMAVCPMSVYLRMYRLQFAVSMPTAIS